jgi:hypothetical protein
VGDEREDFAARSRELAGRADVFPQTGGRVEHALPSVSDVHLEARLADLRDELGGYVDGLAERVAAVEALGAEARQAIANAHEVEAHYDELRRLLRLVAVLLAARIPSGRLDLVEILLADELASPFPE